MLDAYNFPFHVVRVQNKLNKQTNKEKRNKTKKKKQSANSVVQVYFLN